MTFLLAASPLLLLLLSLSLPAFELLPLQLLVLLDAVSLFHLDENDAVLVGLGPQPRIGRPPDVGPECEFCESIA